LCALTGAVHLHDVLYPGDATEIETRLRARHRPAAWSRLAPRRHHHVVAAVDAAVGDLTVRVYR